MIPASPADAVKKLSKPVHYQPGNIVSHSLLHKDSGSLTLFALAQGQGMNEHSTPYEAFILVTEGKLFIRLSGEDYTLADGDMLLMPANSPHSLKAAKPTKMMLFLVKSGGQKAAAVPDP